MKNQIQTEVEVVPAHLAVAVPAHLAVAVKRSVVIVAKSMAIITDGTVTNMIWCSDYTPETETRKDPGDRSVGIGDTYRDGKWYDTAGQEILTPLEQAQMDLESLQSQVDEMDAEYRKGVNSV